MSTKSRSSIAIGSGPPSSSVLFLYFFVAARALVKTTQLRNTYFGPSASGKVFNQQAAEFPATRGAGAKAIG
jgi:hypothetical protein